MPHGRDGPRSRLLDAVWVLQLFGRQRLLLVGYAKRYLRGQRIVTAVVESRVNRVIGRRLTKKQPMRWSRLGAHLLVQIRVDVLGRALAAPLSTLVPEIPPADPTGSPRPLKPPRGFFHFPHFCN